MKTRVIFLFVYLALLGAFQWWVLRPPTHADYRSAWALGVLWGIAFLSGIHNLRD